MESGTVFQKCLKCNFKCNEKDTVAEIFITVRKKDRHLLWCLFKDCWTLSADKFNCVCVCVKKYIFFFHQHSLSDIFWKSTKPKVPQLNTEDSFLPSMLLSLGRDVGGAAGVGWLYGAGDGLTGGKCSYLLSTGLTFSTDSVLKQKVCERVCTIYTRAPSTYNSKYCLSSVFDCTWRKDMRSGAEEVWAARGSDWFQCWADSWSCCQSCGGQNTTAASCNSLHLHLGHSGWSGPRRPLHADEVSGAQGL